MQALKSGKRKPKQEKIRTAIRKEQIAQAALDIIGEQGVAELSVAAVAQRIGLVPSALYRHYRRKDQILDAVLELIGSRLMVNVAAVNQEADDPLERLRLLVARHVDMIRQNQVIVRIVFSEAIYGHHQAWRTKIQTILHAYLQAIADLIRQGQQRDNIHPDIDPEVAAIFFLGLVQPPAILWHITNGYFDLDHQVTSAWEIFRRGIVDRTLPPGEFV
jgi:AcrR family transcriptional regulator